MSSSTPVIEAIGLTKRFGDVEALAGLDLVAQSGRVVAVLGPNGAGKTTFVRTIATLVRPDAGILRVGGVDVVRQPQKVRRMLGLAGQFAAVEEALSGRENLTMVARLFGHGRRAAARNAGAVLEQLGLTDDADRLVRTYSGGMRRKVDLGASLVGAPRLLLLDEPTTGLDPRSRIELWDAIKALVAEGTDVLLTTQYLDEADQLADEIVIIDHGRVIAHGAPAQLKDRAGRDVLEIHALDSAHLPELARALAPLGAEEPRLDPGTRRVTLPVDGGTTSLPEAVRAIDRAGVTVEDIALRRPTLDEVFLALTGLPAGDTDEASLAGDRTGSHAARRRLTSGATSMTSITLTHPGTATVTAPDRSAGPLATTAAVAGRTLRKFVRTPQLVVLGTIQGALFLLIFRYVFGGAIETGDVSYVDFLIPGFVVTGVLFSGMGTAAGVAEDVEHGFFDRLRSLPVPRSALLAGRATADTAILTWGLAVTTAIGFLVGFRIHGSVVEALAAFGLAVVFGFAFVWVFIVMGLTAGSAQAAQGMSLLVFPLTFVSSAYVPVESMPGWLQPVAEHQPITAMVNAVRSLVLGGADAAGLTGSTGYWVAVALLWSLGLVVVFAPIAVARYRRTA